MMGFLRAIWRVTVEPAYRRLFGRYFDQTLRELKALRTELHSHIAGINTRQGQVNAEVIARLDELDRHVRTVIAAGWDDTALARRMAALEDWLDRNGSSASSGSEADKTGQQ